MVVVVMMIIVMVMMKMVKAMMMMGDKSGTFMSKKGRLEYQQSKGVLSVGRKLQFTMERHVKRKHYILTCLGTRIHTTTWPLLFK